MNGRENNARLSRASEDFDINDFNRDQPYATQRGAGKEKSGIRSSSMEDISPRQGRPTELLSPTPEESRAPSASSTQSGQKVARGRFGFKKKGSE